MLLTVYIQGDAEEDNKIDALLSYPKGARGYERPEESREIPSKRHR
jgi:hypothetical protein